MTKYAYQQFVFTGTDDVAVAPFAAVTVTNAADDSPADIWEDADGLNQITGGELLADDEGYFIFYADPGTYNVTITSGGDSKTLTDVTIAAGSGAAAGPVSSIAGADGAVGLAVVSEGGSVTTDGNNISINIKHKPRGMLIIAHRGYADLGPQNTMSAFTAAAASGATVLELDVQVTSDGQFVVFHDDDMTALTGGALTGTVASHTWAEMQNIDVGTHYSPIFASSRIPLFSEFLAFAKKAGVQFWAEIKNYRTSADVTLIVSAVVAAGVEHLCVMQSFNLSDLTAVRAISKAVGLNHAMNAADYSADGAALAALGGEVWRSTSTTRITAAPSYVATLQALGVKVAAYTPTRSQYVQDMQDYGVDAVFVDRYLPGGV